MLKNHDKNSNKLSINKEKNTHKRQSYNQQKIN